MSSLRRPCFLLVSNQSKFANTLTLGAFPTLLPSLWRWCSLCYPCLLGCPAAALSSTLTVPVMFSCHSIFQYAAYGTCTLTHCPPPTQAPSTIRKMKQVHSPAHRRGVESKEDRRTGGQEDAGESRGNRQSSPDVFLGLISLSTEWG